MPIAQAQERGFLTWDTATKFSFWVGTSSIHGNNEVEPLKKSKLHRNGKRISNGFVLSFNIAPRIKIQRIVRFPKYRWMIHGSLKQNTVEGISFVEGEYVDIWIWIVFYFCNFENIMDMWIKMLKLTNNL